MENLIVSAPFGNYHRLLRFLTGASFTPTLGTFTAEPRGFWDPPYGGRFLRVAMTLRYSPAFRSWKNKIGLKNPGAEWLQKQVNAQKINVKDKIVSIYGFCDMDWWRLAQVMRDIRPLAVEVNASCPNVNKPPFNPTLLADLHRYGQQVIVKVPPVNYMPIVKMCRAAGVRIFHATNTLPTPRGGLSGKALLPVALDAVRTIRAAYPDVQIIGGGGITCVEDAEKFTESGADKVALGTMLFTPWYWKRVKDIAHTMDRQASLREVLECTSPSSSAS